MNNDTSFVPSDYTELARHYIYGDGNEATLCQAVVRKVLPFATPDEREDLLQDIAERAIVNDVITKFDPEKASFGGLIFTVARSACVNHLKKKGRCPIRGLARLDLELGTETGDEDSSDSSTRRFDPPATDPLPGEELAAYSEATPLLTSLEEREQNPANKRDRCLAPLVRLLMLGKTVQECADLLEVTTSTVHNWMSFIQSEAGCNH